jgi:hypothetical protein
MINPAQASQISGLCKVISRRDPMAAAVFYILYSLMFPVTLLGYVLWVGMALLAGRNTGVSGTAQGPLSARWFEHQLGTRRDEASSRLMLVLPGVPPLGLRLVTGPLLLAHRLSGYVPKAFRYPFEGDIPMGYQASARQTFFDNVVDRYLPGIAQLVILGAGFDNAPSGCPRRRGSAHSRSIPRRRRRSSVTCWRRPASTRAGPRL